MAVEVAVAVALDVAVAVALDVAVCGGVAGSGAGVAGAGVMAMARGPLGVLSSGMGPGLLGLSGSPMRTMRIYRASRRSTNPPFSSSEQNSSR